MTWNQKAIANPVSRRAVLAGGASLLGGSLFFGGAVPAEAAGKITSTLSWIPNSQFSGLWVALERGYFEDNGVVVEWRPGGPNTPNPVERVASGEVDYGQQANPRPVLEAVTRGNDFVVFGSTFQRQPGGLLSLSRNPIRSPEDIVGKRIICPNPTDARTVEVTLKINNLPPDFTYVPGGFDPQPLVEGLADGMIAFATSQPVVLERQGLVAEQDYFHRTWDDLGQPGYNNFLFGQRDWVEKHRDLLVGYLRSEIHGWRDTMKDPDFAVALTVDKYGADFGLDPAQEKRSLELILPFLQSDQTDKHGLFWIDVERLSGPIYNALRLGGLENLRDPDEFVDMSILKAVHAA